MLKVRIKEKWKVYKSNPNYAVSDFGRVKRLTKGRSTYSGKILKLYEDKNGCLATNFSENGKLKKHYIHRLVLETFVGPCPKGKECNHIDGDRGNNWVGNLEWITHKQNMRHAFKIGLKNDKGENNPNCKLTEREVERIRKLYKSRNYTQIKLGKMFEISQAQINFIVNLKSWKD